MTTFTWQKREHYITLLHQYKNMNKIEQKREYKDAGTHINYDLCSS